MENTVKIVLIEAALNAKVEKTTAGYKFPVVYTLQDGRKIEASQGSRLQRDAKSKLAALPREPQGMSAMFSDDGEYWGIQQVFSLI